MSSDIARLRAEAVQSQPGLEVPCGTARSQPFRVGQLRAQQVTVDGNERVQVDGYASVVEQPYEMYDMFGPYREVVDRGAFDATLAADPDVAFLINHRGVTMARTTNGSLHLSSDDTGLKVRAFLNPKRQDVSDLTVAIEDGDITEMSFAFMIDEGRWSPDYEEYRIKKVDIDRGDVSAVNYGANPYTSIAARSREILAELDKIPAGAARAALERLQSRTDVSVLADRIAEAEAAARPEGVISIDLVEARLKAMR